MSRAKNGTTSPVGSAKFEPEFKNEGERKLYEREKAKASKALVKMPFRAAVLESERQAWAHITELRKRGSKGGRS